MAHSDEPESFFGFVERHKSQLPVVVEIAEGIYGSLEKDSEVRDFSRGDILRILAVKEEVNVTFDSVYTGASKQGLITIDRRFDGSQFQVVSSFQDGYVYKTLDQMVLDFPEFIRVVKPVAHTGVQVGDRLKLLARGSRAGTPSIECRNVRTGETVTVSGDVNDSFAKKSGGTVSMDSLYNRLPQRVRLVRDEGQRIRGKSHGIPGLDPDFSGEMNLSKVEVVEACPWEQPDRIVRIPATTDICVYPRRDWGDRIGPAVDVHEVAKEASPESVKVAVVVDDQGGVPGCPKDSILLVCASQTADYAVARGRGGGAVLIPKTYPSLFKVMEKTWMTVEDLVQEHVINDVNVGTTYKSPEGLDTLHQHDVVRLTGTQPELFGRDCEVVRMERSRSLAGDVGAVTVPTFARGNFYQSADLIGDCALTQILAQRFPLKVTLSRPNAGPRSPGPADADDDDALMTMSPLTVTGQRRVAVTACRLLNATTQAACDDDMVYIPAFSKLRVREITRPSVDVQGRHLPRPLSAVVLRISEAQWSSFGEQTYEQIPPPVPRRVGDERKETTPATSLGKAPGRPPKSLRRIRHGAQVSSQDLPAPRRPSSSSNSPTLTPKLSSLWAGMKRHVPHRSGKAPPSPKPLAGRQLETRALPLAPAQNPYKSVGQEGSRNDDDVDYEVTLIPEIAKLDTDSAADDGGDYERPGDGYEKPHRKTPHSPKGIEVPPKDGDISVYGHAEMVRLLEYLRVGDRMVERFTRQRIDGQALCDLYRSHNDASLQTTLGVTDVKDWLALKYFITTSVSSADSGRS